MDENSESPEEKQERLIQLFERTVNELKHLQDIDTEGVLEWSDEISGLFESEDRWGAGEEELSPPDTPTVSDTEVAPIPPAAESVTSVPVASSDIPDSTGSSSLPDPPEIPLSPSAATIVQRHEEIKKKQSSWSDKKSSRRSNRQANAAGRMDERKDRIEARKPIDLSDAEVTGMRDPEYDDIRQGNDMASNMQRYNRQNISLLKMMQEIAIEGVAETDTIIARFHRVL